MLMLYYIMDKEQFSWKLIDTYFKDNPNFLIYHHLSSYDNFYFNRIHDIFKSSNPLLFNKEYDEDIKKFLYNLRIYMGGKDGKKIYYGKPIIYDEDNDNRQHFMYPNEARLRNMTYGISLFCDVDIEYDIYVRNEERAMKSKKISIDDYDMIINRDSSKKMNEREVITMRINLGKFPIMVQSKLCILRNLSNEVRFNMGECRNDPGGYFIINGKEKVLVSQERKRNNTIYVLYHKDADMSYTSEIKSVSEDTSKPIRSLYIQYNSKDDGIYVNIPNVRESIPLFILMRALGVLSDKDIIQTCLLDMDKYANFIDMFIPSIHLANKIFNKKTAIQYISSFTKHQNHINTLKILTDYLLPHIGEMNYMKKAYFIGYMVKKMLLVIKGIEKPTDRDSYKHKALEVSGKSIEELFIEYYNLQTADLLKKLDYDYFFSFENNISSYSGIKFLDIINGKENILFGEKIIENGFKKAFKGNWGSAAHTKKLGILQDLSRLSYFATICQLRKTNFPISGQGGKVVGPRLLNSTQWGFLCPLHSPDGGNVGLHNHMSCMLRISKDGSKHDLIPLLRRLGIMFIEECNFTTGSKNLL